MLVLYVNKRLWKSVFFHKKTLKKMDYAYKFVSEDYFSYWSPLIYFGLGFGP